MALSSVISLKMKKDSPKRCDKIDIEEGVG